MKKVVLILLIVWSVMAQGPHIVHESPPSKDELDLPSDLQFDVDMDIYGEIIISLVSLDKMQDLSPEGGIGFHFERDGDSRDVRLDFEQSKIGIIEDDEDCQYARLDLLTSLGIQVAVNQLNQDKFKPLHYSHTEIIDDQKYYVYEYNTMALFVMMEEDFEEPEVELLFAHDKGASQKHTLSFIRIRIKRGVAQGIATVPLLDHRAENLRDWVGFVNGCRESSMSQEEMATYIEEEMSNWFI